MQRDGGAVVCQFFAKARAEPRKPFARLTQCEVRTFNVTRADILWRASYYCALYRNYFGRRIAPRRVFYGEVSYRIGFDDCSVRDAFAERITDCRLVGQVTIRRKLRRSDHFSPRRRA